MTSVKYQTLLFDRDGGQILLGHSSLDVFSHIPRLKTEALKLQPGLETPIEIVIHQTGEDLGGIFGDVLRK